MADVRRFVQCYRPEISSALAIADMLHRVVFASPSISVLLITVGVSRLVFTTDLAHFCVRATRDMLAPLKIIMQDASQLTTV